MTIQNQIPKTIIAILLITFSYAIAGLLVDVMWITTYFGINVVSSTYDASLCTANGGENNMGIGGSATAGILNHPLQYTSDLFGDRSGCFGSFDGLSGLALHVGGAFADIVSRVVLTTIGGDEYIPPCSIGLPGGTGDFFGCIQTAIFQIVKFVAGIFAVMIALVAMIISLFRLWFMLLKNYIQVLVDIMFGPIMILLGLIPGSSFGFTQWLRGVFAQLIVFPVAAILLVLASIIAIDPMVNDPTADIFLPPLIGNPNIADGLGAILAFGFILITPTLLERLRDTFKAPAGKASGAVMAGIGLGAGRVMGTTKGAAERYGKRNEIDHEWNDAEGTAKYVKRGFGKVPFTKWRPGGSGT